MGLIDLVFPKNCLECRKEGGYICDSCLKKVERSNFVCSECGRYAYGGGTHSFCKKREGLDGAVSIWKYKGVVRKAIIKLKYNFAYEVAKKLAERAVFEIKNSSLKFDQDLILLPVPLHKRKEKWRGFNQTEILGKEIAESLGWKFKANLVVRRGQTKPQVGLRGKERRENVKGVFCLNTGGSSVLSTASGSRLVVFDDVWTTGATVKEICKVLKRSGAREVWGLTIAS